MKYRINLTGISAIKEVHADDALGAAWNWAYEAPDAIWSTTPEVEIEVRESGADLVRRYRVRSSRQFHVEST